MNDSNHQQQQLSNDILNDMDNNMDGTRTMLSMSTSMPMSISLSFKEYCKDVYFITELILCIVVAALGHNLPSIMIPLHERDIPYIQTAEGDVVRDLYIDREYIENETIPDWLLVVLCILLPFFIMIVISFFYPNVNVNINANSSRIVDVHSSICAYLFAFGSNSFITDCIKRYAGYWRPNFYNYCGFNDNDLQCEADMNILNEPRKSFPSGHSSHSFMGMTMLTLFFLGKSGFYRTLYETKVGRNGRNGRNDIIDDVHVQQQHQQQQQQQPLATLFKNRLLAVLATLPLLLAAYIAASRVHDDFHHPADVITGSIIGMLCSAFSYSLWYAPLCSPFSGYSIYTAFGTMKNNL